MTTREIGSLIAEWQKRLRLRDWKVSFKQEDIVDSFAHIAVKPQSKAAVITIDIRSHYDQFDNLVEDIEATIVHELLHIPVEFLRDMIPTNDKLMEDKFEAAIELTAQALVAAKRGEVTFSGPQ